MIPLWLTGAAQGITGLLGTPEQQRARQDRLALAEIERLYREAQLGLQRETLAETRRLHDLPSTPEELTLPTGEKIAGPRYAIPALIQAAISQGKDVSPEEAGVLSGYRGRALAGPMGVVSRGGIPWSPGLEAEATKKAFPELAGQVSPLTVDLPQVSVPRESFERVMTEAGQQRKEREAETRENLQRKSTARYRQLYSAARSQTPPIPHALADAMAINQATREFGVAPEYQGFVPAPTERLEPKLSLEDEYLKIKRAKPVGPWTDYEQGIIKQYEAQKARPERPRTPFQAAVDIAGGDLQKALDLYRREEQRGGAAVERRASFLLDQAQRQISTGTPHTEKFTQTREQFDALVRARVQQLMQRESPEVQEMVSSMAGLPPPKGGSQTPPPVGEQLSRRDPRYKQLQDRKLTDQQIEAQFGVTLVP